MINRLSTVLICFLFYSVCSSQSKVYTSIQKNSKTYPGKPYTFDRVIDARANKDNIGTVYKTNLVNQYYADLRDSLALAVLGFLNATFPKGSPAVKLTVVINDFEIGHRLSGRAKDTGFVKINFDFYKAVGDSSILVHNYTGSLIEMSEEVALTHSNRMKRIILTAVSPLDSIVLKGQRFYRLTASVSDSTKKQTASVQIPDSVKKLTTGYTKESVEKSEKENNANNYPRNRIIMLGGHAAFDEGSSMFGVNISLLGRLKKHPRSLLGFNINFSKINFADDITLPANTSYQLKTSDFGLRYLRQIKNIFFYNFNPHLMIGKETYTNYYFTTAASGNTVVSTIDNANLFIGGQFDNGIYLLSPKHAGPYLGMDLVIRFTNSDVFDTEFGIKFNLGIAF